VTAPLVAGLVFVVAVVFGTGSALTRSGRPFGTVLLTIHKLVAHAAVVAVGVLAYQQGRVAPFSALEWSATAVAGLLYVVSFASGVAVSAKHDAPAWVVRAHRIGSWLAGVAVTAVVYLLATRG